MSQAPTVPPIVNKTMKFVLRSPVHSVVSKSILLITFTGRKSDRKYTTPVSYSQHGDQIYIFTHGNWWTNLIGGAPVTLRIQGCDHQGQAIPVEDDKQRIAAHLAEHLCKVPSDAKYYDVSFDTAGKPRMDEVEQAVQTVVMIRVHLD